MIKMLSRHLKIQYFKFYSSGQATIQRNNCGACVTLAGRPYVSLCRIFCFARSPVQITAEVGIYKRKQECKETRKQELD